MGTSAHAHAAARQVLGYSRRTVSRATVVVVEDQTVFRELLVALLDAEPGLAVVGQAGSGAEALALVERLRPDLVVLDLVLPDTRGAELLEAMRARVPSLRVVVVTAQDRLHAVTDAHRAGARAIVTKQAALSELRAAIRAVLDGGTHHDATSRALLQEAALFDLAPTPLTARERQIVQLVASGRTSREIASELGISVKTVSNHRFRISEKLGVDDVAGLVRYAVSRGWVSEGA